MIFKRQIIVFSFSHIFENRKYYNLTNIESEFAYAIIDSFKTSLEKCRRKIIGTSVLYFSLTQVVLHYLSNQEPNKKIYMQIYISIFVLMHF